MLEQHFWSAVLFGVTALLLIVSEAGKARRIGRAAAVLAMLTVVAADALMLTKVPETGGLWAPSGRQPQKRGAGGAAADADDDGDARDSGGRGRASASTAQSNADDDADDGGAGGGARAGGSRRAPGGTGLDSVASDVATALAGWMRPAPTAPKQVAGQILKDCPDCPEMVVLPPGRARNVASIAPTAPISDHLPEVNLWPGFAIGRVEITRAQFARFVAETGYGRQACSGVPIAALLASDAPPPHGSDAGSDDAAGDAPAACLGVVDAYAYVAWLSARSGHRYRLPSATEWLYAADLAPSLPEGPYRLGTAAHAVAASSQEARMAAPGAADVAEIVSDCWRNGSGALATTVQWRPDSPPGQTVCVTRTVVDVPRAAGMAGSDPLPRLPMAAGSTSPAIGLRVVRELD